MCGPRKTPSQLFGLLALRLFTIQLGAICMLTGSVVGQEMDFRIETDVMLPAQNKPVQQTLTLFRNAVAYDFSRDTPDQIMVIDHEHERLVLLDSTRQQQAIIDLPGLYTFMESARNQAAVNDKLAVFLEDARSAAFDEATQTVRVGARILRYDATLQSPPQPKMADHYAQFATASAYLNAWRANSPPPFARVALNSEVQKRQAIPSEIIRATQALDGSAGGEQIITCRLHGSWRLSKDDYVKIEQIDGMLVNYAIVSSSEFFSKQSVPAASTAGTNAGVKR